MTPKEVLALCREKDVKAIDMRFMDFPGLWQHFTIPVGKLDEDVFEDGLGFDDSSLMEIDQTPIDLGVGPAELLPARQVRDPAAKTRTAQAAVAQGAAAAEEFEVRWANQWGAQCKYLGDKRRLHSLLSIQSQTMYCTLCTPWGI